MSCLGRVNWAEVEGTDAEGHLELLQLMITGHDDFDMGEASEALQACQVSCLTRVMDKTDKKLGTLASGHAWPCQDHPRDPPSTGPGPARWRTAGYADR